jgi:hypothetical protein
VPHPRPRRRNGDELTVDLLARARNAGDLERRPAVAAIVNVADAVDAEELRRRQTAAFVRLLRQALELRRAA